MTYYDGTKLLSLSDIDGNKPEIYMVTTNRTGGKTTYFGRMFINAFKKRGEKFAILYRFKYELDDCAEKFFKDIGSLFFQGSKFESKCKAHGVYHELFFDGESCGYAIALNSADMIKRLSHLFSDVERILFDEFQSETNHYCDNEVNKLQSIHTSIARGQGKQVRYVPVFMLANTVSIINPYYVAMGISERLDDKTKFLRGQGYVVEQGFVDSASKAQQESGFNKAFSRGDYLAYSTQCVYLNDNKAFIEKPKGNSRYLGTLRYKNCEYGVREFTDLGVIYCDDKPDTTFKNKISVTTDDHTINYVMLKRNDLFIENLRYFFDRGCFRFKDLKCKEVIMKTISY